MICNFLFVNIIDEDDMNMKTMEYILILLLLLFTIYIFIYLYLILINKNKIILCERCYFEWRAEVYTIQIICLRVLVMTTKQEQPHYSSSRLTPPPISYEPMIDDTGIQEW